jgi:co-chaperonin GroES (HSP10)
MIEALFDSIIVEPAPLEQKKKSNIIVPDLGKEKNLGGIIVSVGPGRFGVTGTWISSTLKVGDRVILPPLGPVKIEFEGKEYYGCSETMVLAKINKND